MATTNATFDYCNSYLLKVNHLTAIDTNDVEIWKNYFPMLVEKVMISTVLVKNDITGFKQEPRNINHFASSYGDNLKFHTVILYGNTLHSRCVNKVTEMSEIPHGGDSGIYFNGLALKISVKYMKFTNGSASLHVIRQFGENFQEVSQPNNIFWYKDTLKEIPQIFKCSLSVKISNCDYFTNAISTPILNDPRDLLLDDYPTLLDVQELHGSVIPYVIEDVGVDLIQTTDAPTNYQLEMANNDVPIHYPEVDEPYSSSDDESFSDDDPMENLPDEVWREMENDVELDARLMALNLQSRSQRPTLGYAFGAMPSGTILPTNFQMAGTDPQFNLFRVTTSMDDVTLETLDEAIETANRLEKTIGDIPANIQDALVKSGDIFTKSTLDSLRVKGGFAFGILTVCAGIDYAYNGNVESKYLAITSGVATAGLFGPEIVSFVTDVLMKTSATSHQMAEMPSIIRKSFEYIFECCGNPSMKALKDYIYLITNFSRLKEGLQSILTWFFETIDWLSTKFANTTIIPSSWYSNVIVEKNLINFINRARTFNEDVIYGKIPVTINSYNILKDLMEECIATRLSTVKGSGASVVLETTYRGMNELSKKFGGVSHGCTNNRVEPVCIGLAGGSGVNKSTVANMINQALICSLTMKEADPSNFVSDKFKYNSRKSYKVQNSDYVYVKPISSDFFDGYCNQPICFMDEFGQAVDQAGMKDNPYLIFIAMINTVPFNVPMADLPDKGTTWFDSQYVIYTTNTVEFRPNGVTEKKAVDRRTHVSVIVCPVLEYCMPGQEHLDPWGRTFDYKRYGVNGVIDFEPTMFEFHKRVLSQDKSRMESVAVLTFDEVMKLIFSQRLLNLKHKTANDASAERFAKLYETLYVDMAKTEEQNHAFGDLGLLANQYEAFRSYLNLLSGKHGGLFIDFNDFIKTMIVDHGSLFVEDIVEEVNIDYWCIVAERYFPVLKPNDNMKAIEDATLPSKTVIENIQQFVSDNKFALGLATVIGGMWFMGRNLMADVPTEFQSPTMVRPKNNSNLKSVQEIARQYHAQHVTDHQMGASEDPNGDLWSDSIIRNNCFTMLFGGVPKGQVVFFHSTLAIMPAHFVIYINMWLSDPEHPTTEDTSIEFRCGQQLSKAHTHFFISVKEFLNGIVYYPEMDGSELVVVRFPVRIGAKPNIIKTFKSGRSLKQEYNQIVLKMAFHNAFGVTIDQHRGNAIKMLNHPINEVDGTLKYVKVTYHTDHVTQPGHCGAIMIELNRKSNEKFIGLHISGDPKNRTAVSAPVHKEWLLAIVEHLERCDTLISDSLIDKVHEQTLAGEEVISSYQMSDEFPDNPIVGYGKPIPQMAKTTWTRSRMCGLFQQPTMAPALLHPKWVDGTLIDPKKIALSGYGNMSGFQVDEEVFGVLMDSEVDYYNSHSPEYVEDREFSIFEAIEGLDDDIDSGPISRSSSPGYPYVHVKNGSKGKTFWFGNESLFDYSSPAFKILQQQIETERDLLARGILPEFVFVTNLKDELRKWAKLEAFATRNFSASPLNLTIHCTMSFGAMIVFSIKNRILNGMTIGVNPYSSEWDLIARKLIGFNSAINAGDFEAFDKKHIPPIVVAGFKLVDNFYQHQTPRERAIRWTLWTTLWRTNQLVGGEVVAWYSSLPSGHKLTAWWNSINNRIVHKFSFHQLYIEYQDKGFIEEDSSEFSLLEWNQYYVDNKHLFRRCYEAFWLFNDGIMMFTHGDDSLFSAKPQYQVFFNENNIAKPMKLIGQIYTAEDKSTSDRDRVRNIFEITFLKRYFRYEKLIGGYVGPMKMERVKEMVNWTRTTDSDIILRDKCGVVAREFVLHGREVAVPLIQELNTAFKRIFGVGMDKTNFLILFLEVCSSEVLPFVSNFQMSNTTNTQIYRAIDNNIAVIEPLKYIMQDNFSTVKYATYFQMDTVVNQSTTENGASDLVFNDDAVVIAKTPMAPTRSERMIGDFRNTEGFDDIKRALGRPMMIASGALANGDVPSTFSKFGWELAATSALNAAKLSGVAFMKGDLIIDFVVNADPFVLGLYNVSFLYTGGITGTAVESSDWALMHCFSKCQISQLPCTYLNLGCDTRVSLRIPWKSAFHGWIPNAAAPKYISPGFFFIYPFKSLVNGTGGSSTATYTLWAHYENVELGAATYPQMDFLEKETPKNSKKVSAHLRSIGQIARTFSVIPVLSSIAGPTAGILDAAANLASSLGFSKPPLVETPMRALRVFNPYMGVSDGVDSSEPLAITAHNHVELAPDLTGSELDEMSIDFIKSVPGYFALVNLSTSDTASQLIIGGYIAPWYFALTAVDGTLSGIYNFTPVSYLVQGYNFWRGTLVIRARIVKTRFHSGRYMIVVNYGESDIGAVADPTVTTSQYCYRQIIDIRECDEFEVPIPYVHKTPWCECGGLGAGPSLGTWSIVCVDPLVCPASVATSISLVLEVQGGKDFQVASPTPLAVFPIIPSAFQMGVENEEQCILTTAPIGGMSIVDSTVDVRSVTMGEACTSWRQNVKRYSAFTPHIALATGTTYQIPIFNNYWGKSNGTVVNGTVGNMTLDWYSSLSSIYAFSRGGMRIAMVPDGTSTTNVMAVGVTRVSVVWSSNFQYMVNGFSASVDNFYFTQGTNPNSYFVLNAPITYFVPQNTQTLHRLNSTSYITTTKASYPNAKTYSDPNVFVVNQMGSSPVPIVFLRAGADDCSFSCFTSIPPMYAYSAPA